MVSLYQFLTEEKNYTEADAEITVLMYDIGLDIPNEIKKDIKDYHEKRLLEINPKKKGYCMNNYKSKAVGGAYIEVNEDVNLFDFMNALNLVTSKWEYPIYFDLDNLTRDNESCKGYFSFNANGIFSFHNSLKKLCEIGTLDSIHFNFDSLENPALFINNEWKIDFEYIDVCSELKIVYAEKDTLLHNSFESLDNGLDFIVNESSSYDFSFAGLYKAFSNNSLLSIYADEIVVESILKDCVDIYFSDYDDDFDLIDKVNDTIFEIKDIEPFCSNLEETVELLKSELETKTNVLFEKEVDGCNLYLADYGGLNYSVSKNSL